MPLYVETFDHLVDALTLMVANLPTYQTEVGATAADITWANETLENLLYVRDYCATIDANKKACYDIKASYFNAEKDSKVSGFPATAAGAFPNLPVKGGQLYEFRDRQKRFKLGPGYTKEIGIAIGIDGNPSTPVPEGEIKPVIDVFAAQTGASFSIVVSNRGQSDQWEVQILRSGSSTWETAATKTGKSADIHVTLTTPGKPEQIQVRVQLIKSNAPYGQLSDAATATINP